MAKKKKKISKVIKNTPPEVNIQYDGQRPEGNTVRPNPIIKPYGE